VWLTYVPDVAYSLGEGRMEDPASRRRALVSILRPVQLMQNIEWSLQIILERGMFEIAVFVGRRNQPCSMSMMW